MYVHENVYDEFVSSMKENYLSSLRIGDPFQPGVNVGPIHHERQRKQFEQGIKDLLSQGSQLLVGGKVLDGNFVEPTLMLAPHLKYEAIREERFVPISHIVKYKENELDEVIKIINEVNFSSLILSISRI